MPKLRIPNQHHKGISKLLGWDPTVVDQFVAALEGQPPNVSLFSRVPSSIILSNIAKDAMESVSSAVTALYLVRATADVDLDDFIEDASEAIAVFDATGLSQQSKDRLRKVLGIDSLASSAKALVLLTEHERTLHSVRILTDVRHVFQSDPEKEPYGAVVFHILKLNYHENGQHKDFFIALDGDDLANLRIALDRADEKTKTVKRKLALADIAYLGGADRRSREDN